jgi:hypothetical protein
MKYLTILFAMLLLSGCGTPVSPRNADTSQQLTISLPPVRGQMRGGKKIYHLPGCGPETGENLVEFKTVKEAEELGFQPTPCSKHGLIERLKQEQGTATR